MGGRFLSSSLRLDFIRFASLRLAFLSDEACVSRTRTYAICPMVCMASRSRAVPFAASPATRFFPRFARSVAWGRPISRLVTSALFFSWLASLTPR